MIAVRAFNPTLDFQALTDLLQKRSAQSNLQQVAQATVQVQILAGLDCPKSLENLPMKLNMTTGVTTTTISVVIWRDHQIILLTTITATTETLKTVRLFMMLSLVSPLMKVIMRFKSLLQKVILPGKFGYGLSVAAVVSVAFASLDADVLRLECV